MAGGKLKETGTMWRSPNTGATNSSGFMALPGGTRDSWDGSFYNVGYGYWWSSTANGATYAWDRGLGYDVIKVGRDAQTKQNGQSVRCVRD